jgi:molecular chaperone GrpE
MARKTKAEKNTPAEPDESPDQRIENLEQRCEELNTLWLRAQADYKNLRRRAVTDSEAELKREMQPLLEELLLVLDFLDMALSSPAESEDAKNLSMGVQMTRTKFVQALEAAQLKSISTDGTFDPAVHEAAETRADTSVEPGTIVETVRRGYTWHDLVLRPAVVVVARADGDDEPTELEEQAG